MSGEYKQGHGQRVVGAFHIRKSLRLLLLPAAEPEPVVLGQLPSVYWIEGGALCYRSTGGERERGACWSQQQNAVETLTGGLAVDMAGGRSSIGQTENGR